MIFPIGDDNTDRATVPIVNYLLIIINVLVFIFLQSFGNDLQFTYAFSTVPAEIFSGKDIVTAAHTVTDPVTGENFLLPGLPPTPIPVYFTLITSMFLHGGVAHIVGNMIFLWIFGDNVEDRLGHIRYLLFYLVCGVIASLCHVFITYLLVHDPLIPSLGASGAISGVLGAYLLLFPGRRVTIIFIFRIMQVPAIFAIGIWILFQVLSGLGMLGGTDNSGVAYFAHIGGFFAGLLLIKFFTPRYSGGSKW